MTHTLTAQETQTAHSQKNLVALSSVLAAVFLTGIKLVVGLATGSLGILSEAAHSLLDLVAAVATLVAVRVSGHPADNSHNYGHGKVENLSALFETILLLATCVWIIYEAIQRLFFREVLVETSIWSFIVMGTSIIIDYSRSRALMHAAKKYDSQALEADALHFSTDIWSSSVVIIGLGVVAFARWQGILWLEKADALAALGVAGIVVYVSMQLGWRTIVGLLDGVPVGLREDVVRAAQVPGVVEVKRARVRRSGPESFADIVLTVAPNTPLEKAHEISNQAQQAVQNVLPRADVIVQVDPGLVASDGLVETVRLLAMRQSLGVHSIHLYDMAGARTLEMHLEVPDSWRMAEAHREATRFEEALQTAIPGLDEVVTHIEPAGDDSATHFASPEDEARLSQAVMETAARIGVACQPHQIHVRRVEDELVLSFHCSIDPMIDIAGAHAISEQMERELRHQVPELERVVIHLEPSEEG
jgi:cation diffusion facilitator family transporter